MQHTIKIEEIGVRGEAMVGAIQSCVHCGFCLAACPTYQLLGEEMDSPRGRIYLMKSVMEGTIEAADAQPYIDRCLGCVACVPACPSGVPYGDLLMAYRANTEAERERPFIDQVTRTLVAETLPYPNRFRMAVRTGKLARLAKSALPDKVGAMIGLLPDRLPAAPPLPQIYPAQGKRRARVALLAGCVQQVLAPEINWATLRVLAANGVETVIPAGQGCCGSIMMHIGEDKRAQKLAQHNLDSFPADVDAIITNAAGCGSGIHDYPLLFTGQPSEARAAVFAKQTLDITQFLANLGLVNVPPLKEPLKVAYQDACHLRHAQGVQSAPRQLLSAIPNLTLLDLNDGGQCCGSAGTYNIEQPELAHRLGQQKATHILDSGADAIASGNIGCITQIQTHLAQKGRELPVFHTIELLDQALSNG